MPKDRKEYFKTYQENNSKKIGEYKKIWKKNNPDKAKEYGAKQVGKSREWKKKNPDYSKEYSKRTSAKYYALRREKERENPDLRLRNFFSTKKARLKIKLSYEEYKEMFITQNNTCAICLNPETSVHHKSGVNNVLSIDHSHKTNKVRGLLCRKCNMAIGLLRDNPEIVLRAYNYLLSRI